MCIHLYLSFNYKYYTYVCSGYKRIRVKSITSLIQKEIFQLELRLMKAHFGPSLSSFPPLLLSSLQRNIQRHSPFLHKVHRVELQHVACLSSQGCHNKVPQSGWLGQQSCVASQFWRLEIQDQGVRGPPWYSSG